MRSKERIELSRKEWINHFEMPLILLIPVIGFGFFWIEDPSNEGLIYPLLLFLITAIFFYWLNWNRLFFQEYKAEMTDEEFIRAIKLTAAELSWHISKLEGKSAEAFREPAPLGNGGEHITIKKVNGRLLINSRRNLEASNGYSIRRNKENVNSFIENTTNILKGENAERIIFNKQVKKKEEFWEESEWTIKKILMRIIGYGLVLFFLGISFLCIYEEVWAGIFFIIIIGGLGFTYIKNDIIIIREKNRRRKIKR